MWACNQTVSDCLADHTCLPVGGQSVWAAATRLRPTADVDYVAVSAPMDSAAFFHSRAIGAVAEVSALVTMLAVAEAFGSVVAANRTRPLRRVPVFMGFNAEAYGYAGSRRFLNDIVNFECADEEDAGSMGSGVCETPHYMSSLKFQAFRRQPSDGTEDGGTTTRFTHVLDVGPVGSAAKLREPVTLEPVNATAAADATPRPVTLADLETPPLFRARVGNLDGPARPAAGRVFEGGATPRCGRRVQREPCRRLLHQLDLVPAHVRAVLHLGGALAVGRPTGGVACGLRQRLP